MQFAQGTGSVALSWSANAGAQAPQGYLVLCSDTPKASYYLRITVRWRRMQSVLMAVVRFTSVLRVTPGIT